MIEKSYVKWVPDEAAYYLRKTKLDYIYGGYHLLYETENL